MSCFSFPEHFLNYGRFKFIIPNTASTISLPVLPCLSPRTSACWNFIAAIFLVLESNILVQPHNQQQKGYFHPHTYNCQLISLVYCSLRWDFKMCQIFPRSCSCSCSLPHPLLFRGILWGGWKWNQLPCQRVFLFTTYTSTCAPVRPLEHTAAGTRSCLANVPCLIGTKSGRNLLRISFSEFGLREGYFFLEDESVYWLGIFLVHLFSVVVNLD